MKIYFSVVFSLLTLTAWSQQDSAAKNLPFKNATYQRHMTIATVSLGFIDFYRQYYSVPKGFEKNNTSGYSLVYGKLEYGLSNTVSLAATFGYDAFTYNFSQLYTGYNGIIKRNQTDHLRAFSGGVTAFYHLGRVIQSKRLDPFIGIGVSLNNIRHSAYPQGDSTMIKSEHKTTPYLKAGARYYISSKFSLFGDAGYDQQSIFSIGASCRLFSKEGTK